MKRERGIDRDSEIDSGWNASCCVIVSSLTLDFLPLSSESWNPAADRDLFAGLEVEAEVEVEAAALVGALKPNLEAEAGAIPLPAALLVDVDLEIEDGFLFSILIWSIVFF